MSSPGGRVGRVLSDGYRIHYEVHGRGRPIVLVHGWGGSVETAWKATGWVDALTPIRQVVAVDVRGHGDSDKPHVPDAYGYAAMAGDVLAVMDDLGIERADLMGHSLGAFSGVWLLGHRPERFSAVVLAGIGDETDESLAALPSIVTGLRAADPAGLDDEVARLYRSFVDHDPRNDREALAVAAQQMWPGPRCRPSRPRVRRALQDRGGRLPPPARRLIGQPRPGPSATGTS